MMNSMLFCFVANFLVKDAALPRYIAYYQLNIMILEDEQY